MVIAPSSIEAHVWRRHLHGERGCEAAVVDPCPCEL
jgi:hypothetical protein